MCPTVTGVWLVKCWLQSLDENAVAESKDTPVVVRKTRQAPADTAPAAAAKDEEYEDDDQSAAATGGHYFNQKY